MRINGVEHYQIMTRFTQPGVIFAKKEDRKKVSVADILIGCRVVFYNDTHKHIDGLDAIADLCQRHTNDVSLGAFYTEILSRVISEKTTLEHNFGDEHRFVLDECSDDMLNLHNKYAKHGDSVFLRELLICMAGRTSGGSPQVTCKKEYIDYYLNSIYDPSHSDASVKKLLEAICILIE